MTDAAILDRIDEILDLIDPQQNGGKGGLSEARRSLIEGMLRSLRDEIEQGD